MAKKLSKKKRIRKKQLKDLHKNTIFLGKPYEFIFDAKEHDKRYKDYI